MSKADARRFAPRVTVTHEKNAPVALSPRKKDPVQSAWGNGVASTMVFTDPLVVTAKPPEPAPQPEKVEVETVATEPPATVARKDGTIEFEPDHITAKPPEQAAEDKPPETVGEEEKAPEEVAKDSAKEEQGEEISPEEEEAAGEEPEDPMEREADAVADEVLKPEPPKVDQPQAKGGGGGGGSDGASDLAAWKARVGGAAQAVPQPKLGDEPAAKVTVIAGVGKKAAGRAKAGGGGALAAEAKKAVRKPPETPKQLPPPPPTPVPEADQAIADASDKKLPNQELPQLVQRPADPTVIGDKPAVPVMDTGLADDFGSKIELPPPEPAPELAPGEKKPLDAKQVEKLKDAKAAAPEENRKGKPGEKMTLQDVAPTPTPGVEIGTKGQSKEKVAQVLAELLRSPGPDGAADEIIMESRREAYPRGALQERAPKMGEEKKNDVLAELKAQVDSIRQIAGISQVELDAAIKTREENVKKLAEGVKVELETAGEDAKKETKDSAEKTAEEIAGARDAVDEQTIQTLIAANGEADPTVIELRRDKGIRDLTRRAARQDVFYEKAGERRGRALDTAKGRMKGAYMKAADADKQRIYNRVLAEELDAKKKADPKADAAAKKAATADAEATAKSKSEAESTPIYQWSARQSQALDRTFSELKDAAAASTKKFRDGITTALSSAKGMLRSWADDLIARQEGFWDRLIRLFNEWTKEAKDDSAAWEEARNEQLRDTLVGDMAMIDDIQKLAQSGVDMNAHLQERGLDEAQMEIVKTYFAGSGPKDKKQLDSIGAVAAGMRIRVKLTRKPGLIEWFKNHVMTRPDSEYELMGWMGHAEKPPFDVVALASDLHEAMDQWGTDEDKIFRTLNGLTPLQARAVRARYQIRYGRSLDSHLASEMSGAELGRAKAQLEGNQTVADAAALYEAMSGLGTNEDTIMQVLRGKTAEERAAIVAEYNKRYGGDLEKDLKSELDDGWSGPHDAQRADALMKGDTRKADAIALDQAMRGAGTDEAAITRIYEQNRAEIEAEAAQKGWSTDEMEAKLRERNAEIDTEYESKYGDPNRPTDQPSALTRAFKEELSGAELGLAEALVSGDMTAIDAAKLGVEKQSFITDDEAVNKILESQNQRARKDVERDRNLELQFKAEVDAMRGQPWDRDRWTKERTDAKAETDRQVKERSMLYMSNLETRFDKDWNRGREGGLVVMLAFNLSGEESQKAFNLLNQGGVLTPEQEIYYAVNGAGTDVDKLKEVLKGKSPDEIKALKKVWADKYPDEGPLEARIMEEVGGNDAKEMEWGLKGEPQTLDEQIARAHERKEYYKGATGIWGSYEAEAADIDRQYERLVAEKSKLDELKHLNRKKEEGESEEAYSARLDRYAYWEDSFKLQKGTLDRAIEDHEKAVNAFADTAATIAGIVAVIAVMVIVGIATGGAGAAAIGAALASAKVAALAAVAGAAATIGTKALIKGKSYSREEIAIDVVVGAVDAVASAMTAGVGGGLLKAARTGVPASRLAGIAAKSKLAAGLSKMAASERMAARVFAGAMSEGLEGVASSLPSALAGNVLDEKNWLKGNPLLNIAQGTVIQTGMGAVLSGGIGGLGGIGKNIDAPPVRETGDVLAKRGPVADRMPLWKAWQVDNPGKPYDKFLEQLDAGIIAKDVDETARKAMQREMRRELLAEIPEAQRKQFAGVPIEVMSDADFHKFTNSKTGQAVVIFKDGKPVVILREGADIKALREEGIHLVQSKDPKWAKKFKQLDETRLANWEKLPLDEQLALYRTKLDIEIDAQQRLLKSLDDQLAGIDDPALRKSLLARRDAAAKTFENLSKRMDEVAGMSPLDKLKIARREMDPPQYLDQKPRLFSKGDPGDVDAKPAPSKRSAAGQLEPDYASARKGAAETQDVRKAVDASLAAAEAADPASKAAAVRDSLQKVWTAFSKGSSNFLTRAADEILSGKKFADLFGKIPGGPNLYDATVALRTLAEVTRNLVEAKQLDRLEQVLDAVSELRTSGLELSQIEPFLKIAPQIENLGKLTEVVKQLASLASFRNNALPKVGDAIGEVLEKKGPKLAQEFVEDLRKLGDLTKNRDAIGKGKPGWDEAQAKLVKAGEELQANVGKYGLTPGTVEAPSSLDSVLEEMARTGRFDWNVFKEKWGEALPLSKEEFRPLHDLLDDLRIAKGNNWQDFDVGPLRLWGPVFKKVYETLGDDTARQGMIAAFKKQLDAALPGLDAKTYATYRRSLKKLAVDFATATDDAAEQLARIGAFTDLVPDPASKGEFFNAFMRKIFDGKTRAIKGDLAGSIDVALPSRTIAGSKRMVDGAIQIPTGGQIPNGPKDGGLFYVEYKAGESLDLDQTGTYSDLAKVGKLKVGDSEPAAGLIIITQKPSHADTYANELTNLEAYKEIYVVSFGPGDKMVFWPRGEVLDPAEKASKSKSKSKKK